MSAADRPAPQGDDFLARMGHASRSRVGAALRSVDRDTMVARALATPPPPALQRGEFTLLAEVKLAAPSRGGQLGTAEDIGTRARAYASGGAAAISVLTEPEHFAGSLAHLATAATYAGDVPVMRKDFLVDPYQVYEARAAGAGGVLLIAELLDDSLLAAMLDAARQCGLFVLLEAFAEQSLQRAAHHAGEHVLVGVNCRDLRTLRLDPARFGSLASTARAVGAVAESGLDSADDVAAIAELGYRGALVGTALMRCDDPVHTVAAMADAGRRVACRCA